MKRKVLAGILMLVMTAGMVAGCGKKDVDYSLGTEASSKTAIDEYRKAEKWTDEWSITNASGIEQKIRVNAEIVVPDVDGMRVVETERYGDDVDFWKKCLDGFFGSDTVYYYNDYDHWTKAQIEENIQKQADELDPSDISTWPDYEQERYRNAPDEPIPVEEFDCDEELYTADRNGISYSVSIGWGSMGIQGQPSATREYGPERFRDYKNVYEYADVELGENVPNECKYSMEDAKALADAYLKDIGLGSLECMESRDNIWRANNTADNATETADEYAKYGYSFCYGTGVDGVAFSRFPNFRALDSDEWNGGGVSIKVTDEGITYVLIMDPESICDMTDQTTLLPLDNIKEIMKNEAIENSDKYEFVSTSSFSKLQLVYMAEKSPEEDGRFKYIPVWCLTRVVEAESMVPDATIRVNAIDGSIIYP